MLLKVNSKLLSKIVVVASLFLLSLSLQAQNKPNLDDTHFQGQQNRRFANEENDRFHREKLLNNVIYSKKFKKLLKKDYPKVYSFINKLGKTKKIDKILKKIAKLEHIKRRRFEMYAISKKIILSEIEIDMIAYKYNNTKLSKSEKKLKKLKIKEKLTLLFDIKEQERKSIIDNLVKKIKKEKEKQNFRIKNKNKIINKRILDLLDYNNKNLNW